MPKLLIVLLNYRTADMTLRAARSALAAMDGLHAELVVVDNDSGDGSEEALRAGLVDQPQVRVIQSGHNGGFGAGNNVGIHAGMADGSRPDYVYLLNSDAFPEPDALRLLMEHMENTPKAAFAGSQIFGEDGETHSTAFRFPSIWSELEGAARFGPISRLLAGRRVPMPVPTEMVAVDWVAGASLMMRMDALDKIGVFDETFFLYFEETELCLRAARAGYETHYLPQSRVMHIGSVSTGMRTWQRIPGFWLDSRWQYFSGAHGRAYALAATCMHIIGGLLWRLRRLLQGKPPADPPHFLRDLIAHDLGALFRPAPKPQPRAAAAHVE